MRVWIEGELFYDAPSKISEPGHSSQYSRLRLRLVDGKCVNLAYEAINRMLSSDELKPTTFVKYAQMHCFLNMLYDKLLRYDCSEFYLYL